MSWIWIVLGLIVALDLKLQQLDVKISILQGYLEEEVYMEQPKCLIEKGKEKLIHKFKNSLHGLKQAPFQYYTKFDFSCLIIMLKG